MMRVRFSLLLIILILMVSPLALLLVMTLMMKPLVSLMAALAARLRPLSLAFKVLARAMIISPALLDHRKVGWFSLLLWKMAVPLPITKTVL